MKKMKSTIVIIAIVLSTIALGIVGIFFATAYEEVNRVIFTANLNDVSDFENEPEDEDDWMVSPKFILKARVIDSSFPEEEVYVNRSTRYGLPSFKNGKMTINCTIKATVNGFEDDFKKTYQGDRSFQLVFENWRWRIVSVK